MYNKSLVHHSMPLQEILDADDDPLKNQYGEKMSRDIVQFVPFRQFRSKSGADFSLVGEAYTFQWETGLHFLVVLSPDCPFVCLSPVVEPRFSTTGERGITH